jgi:hypothetical protein
VPQIPIAKSGYFFASGKINLLILKRQNLKRLKS